MRIVALGLALAFLMTEVHCSARIIEDYTPPDEQERRTNFYHELYRLDPPENYEGDPAVVKFIEELNKDPANEEHLQKVLATMTHKTLVGLYRTGVYLLKCPQHLDDVASIKFGRYWADSRALYIMNFLYLVNPDINPWLRYYYAFSLVCFPELAVSKFEKKNPVQFAFAIFDQWLGTLELRERDHEPNDNNREAVPLQTFAIHDETGKYEKAYKDFYALIEIRLSGAEMHIERQLSAGIQLKDCKTHPWRNDWFAGILKYNLERNTNFMRHAHLRRDGYATWLEGPAYFALGVAAVTALTLATRRGDATSN